MKRVKSFDVEDNIVVFVIFVRVRVVLERYCKEMK